MFQHSHRKTEGGVMGEGVPKMVNFASNGDDLISPSSPPTRTSMDSASVTGAIIPPPPGGGGGGETPGVGRRTYGGDLGGGAGSLSRPPQQHQRHPVMNSDHYACDCCRIDEDQQPPYPPREFTPSPAVHRSEVRLACED